MLATMTAAAKPVAGAIKDIASAGLLPQLGQGIAAAAQAAGGQAAGEAAAAGGNLASRGGR
jgi:hypothetical protein